MAAPSVLSPMSRLAPADHGFVATEDLFVVVETGSWRVRCGVLNLPRDGEGEGGIVRSYFDDFPCCVARPRREGMDLNELVNGASSLAAPMYSKFRDIGLFVGGDAWYCVMDHPDSGLRSKLNLSCPMERGHVTSVEDASRDVERLWEHAYMLLKQDSSQVPIILPYKPTATPDELWQMVSVLFEVLKVPAVRLANEATLATMAAGIRTGVVVDLGESGVYVTPVYEGYPLTESVRAEKVGGGDLTKYLDYMLLSRTNEQFNQLVDRRRLEYARKIKENKCYVSADFEMEAGRAGHFKRKSVRVMGSGEVSPKLSNYAVCSATE
ncbi:unnamed protein product [Choristocarpus tenellus]